MNTFRKIASLDALTPEQRRTVAAWLKTHSYERTAELAATELKLTISIRTLRTFRKRLALGEFTPHGDPSYLHDLIDYAATGRPAFQQATLALLEQCAFFTLETLQHRPDPDLDHARFKLQQMQTAFMLLIHHRRATSHETQAANQQRNVQIRENKLALDRLIFETKRAGGWFDKSAHRKSSGSQADPALVAGTPENPAPPHPTAAQYTDCATYHIDGKPLHGPQRWGGCGVLTTDDWDEKQFDIWGLVEPERQKRRLYNSMLDLGIPSDLAELYRDEILHHTGVTTGQEHYVPACDRPFNLALNAWQPTPAQFHLQNYGLSGPTLQKLAFSTKDHPVTFAHPPTLAPELPANQLPTDQTPVDPNPVERGSSQAASSIPQPPPLPEAPLNTELAARRQRLHNCIASVGLSAPLTHAYLHELLQLCHPAFIPGQTEWAGADASRAQTPEPSEEQIITHSIYPTPADIHLARHRRALDNENANDRWALPPNPPNQSSL